MSAELLVKNASNFFLNDHNILNILNNSFNKTIQKKKKKQTTIQQSIKKDDFFYPSDKHINTLFWCWNIFHNGLDNYYSSMNNIYQDEQTERISYVDFIRKNKNKVKEIKMKRNVIENNIVHESQISFNSILTLTHLFDYNFIYLTEKLYFEKISNPSNKTCIIKKTNKKYGIWLNDINNFDILAEGKKRFHVENIEKPLKAITNYKKAQLEEICENLKINITTEKKITKQRLYAAIQEYII
jgi:hypothetical protein